MHDNASMVAVEGIAVAMLLIIAAVAFVVRRWQRVPYTVALVLCGLAIALFHPFAGLTITADIILFIFIPPLIFEAAFHLNIQELRNSLAPIIILSVLGVLVSTFIMGGILAAGAGIPLIVALVFGALISATDPVAVIATFARLGVPRRLSHLVDGESLFNDGTAIVLFRILLAIWISGTYSWSTIGQSVLNFLVVTIGGLVLGTAVGVLASLILRRIDDYLIEITVTTVAAYGTYLLAEELGVSGVISVVVAGLILGNYAAPRAMSPTTRIVLTNFWEYVAFLANSFVFILIGAAMDVSLLWENIWAIAWAVIAMLASRAVVIYGMGAPIDRFTRTLPMRWRHVLFWGGLRGAVGLALVLSLPVDSSIVPWLGQVRAMTFGVVLFTLLVQGTTIEWLLGRLGFGKGAEQRREYELARARLYAREAAMRRLSELSQEGVLPTSVWRELVQGYRSETAELADRLHDLYEEKPGLRRDEMISARLDALRAERTAIEDLLRQGTVSEEAYSELVSEVNRRRQEIETAQD